MINILYPLTRPWSYWAIRHSSANEYNFIYPAFCAILISSPILYAYLFHGIDIFSKTGLIRDIVSFLSTLPGFFIAALAAIASFGRPEMDESMPSKPTLTTKSAYGIDLELELPRRRFLCNLFAFLTAQSLTICLFSLMLVHLAPIAVALIISKEVLNVLGSLTIVLFIFFVSQLLITTALGLYYLGEKIHLPKS